MADPAAAQEKLVLKPGSKALEPFFKNFGINLAGDSFHFLDLDM